MMIVQAKEAPGGAARCTFSTSISDWSFCRCEGSRAEAEILDKLHQSWHVDWWRSTCGFSVSRNKALTSRARVMVAVLALALATTKKT